MSTEDDDSQKMVEPIRIEEHCEWIVDAEGRIIAYDEGTLGIGIGDDRSEIRARRIVAAVNACRGMELGDLENGLPISRRLKMIRDDMDIMSDDVMAKGNENTALLRERDEARAMVKEMASIIRDHGDHDEWLDEMGLTDDDTESEPNVMCPSCFCVTPGTPEKCPNCGEALS